jgi:hypothetical protein
MRVSRSKPCPVCGKGDWCLLAKDGSAAICARVESTRRAGDAGFLHRLRDDRDFRPRQNIRTIAVRPPEPITSFADLAAEFRRAADPRRLRDLSLRLGLSASALDALGIGWSSSHGAWSFPMTDAAGRTLGIRLRKPDGFKYAVTGGKEGLFLPSITPTEDTMFVVEGATDAAALVDLGCTSVAGRPSCGGGVRHVVDLVRARTPRHLVVVADADAPGRRGAEHLASVLVAYVPQLRLIDPPAGLKDVRAWLRAGGTRADLVARVGAAPVRKLTIRSTSKAGF